MAGIVNLRRARKARARRGAEAEAVANRAVHGRTLADRQRATQDAERRDRELDGARRER